MVGPTIEVTVAWTSAQALAVSYTVVAKKVYKN